MAVVASGSMRVPSDLSIDSVARWEQSFFESEFSHIGGVLRLTKHPEGFAGLWKELADAPGAFPLRYLAEAKESLRQFVERNVTLTKERPPRIHARPGVSSFTSLRLTVMPFRHRTASASRSANLKLACTNASFSSIG